MAVGSGWSLEVGSWELPKRALSHARGSMKERVISPREIPISRASTRVSAIRRSGAAGPDSPRWSKSFSSSRSRCDRRPPCTAVSISTSAALSAERVDRIGVAGLRQLGVTRQKAAYCHGLARRVLDGTLDLAAVARASDDEGRRMLLDVPGLGPWSVDIYFLMALRRPDVWPRGDLALASALRDVKRLRTLPSHDEQQKLSQAWEPWRSVAARILWAHYLAQRGVPI